MADMAQFLHVLSYSTCKHSLQVHRRLLRSKVVFQHPLRMTDSLNEVAVSACIEDQIPLTLVDKTLRNS